MDVIKIAKKRLIMIVRVLLQFVVLFVVMDIYSWVKHVTMALLIMLDVTLHVMVLYEVIHVLEEI